MRQNNFLSLGSISLLTRGMKDGSINLLTPGMKVKEEGFLNKRFYSLFSNNPYINNNYDTQGNFKNSQTQGRSFSTSLAKFYTGVVDNNEENPKSVMDWSWTETTESLIKEENKSISEAIKSYKEREDERTPEEVADRKRFQNITPEKAKELYDKELAEVKSIGAKFKEEVLEYHENIMSIIKASEKKRILLKKLKLLWTQ